VRCEQVQQRLEGFADGTLSQDARREFQQHLTGCRSCQQALARRGELVRLLQEVRTPPVPDGFAASVLARAKLRLPGQEVGNNGRPLRWWRGLSVPMRVAASLALVSGLAAGAIMGRDAGRGSPPAPIQNSAMASTGADAVYRLNALTEAPDGSLSQVYLALAQPRKDQE